MTGIVHHLADPCATGGALRLSCGLDPKGRDYSVGVRAVRGCEPCERAARAELEADKARRKARGPRRVRVTLPFAAFAAPVRPRTNAADAPACPSDRGGCDDLGIVPGGCPVCGLGREDPPRKSRRSDRPLRFAR